MSDNPPQDINPEFVGENPSELPASTEGENPLPDVPEPDPSKVDKTKKKQEGKERGRRKCPFCNNSYVHGRSLRFHITDKHSEKINDVDETVQDQIKAATKATLEVCPLCKKFKSNLRSVHLKTCRARHRATEGLDPARDFMSNAQFCKAFKKHVLKSGKGLTMQTAKNYLVYVSRIIRMEEEIDENFKATNWFANTGAREYQQLRDPEFYLANHFGNSSARNFAAAYKVLHTWIRKGLLEQEDTPLARHDRLLPSIREIQHTAKRGKFRRASKKDLEESTPGHSQEGGGRVEIDLALVQKILDSYLSSKAREEGLNNFRSGRYTSPELGIYDADKSYLFLSLEIYLRGKGTRLDVVRNLKVSDVYSAKPVRDRCPFCQAIAVYQEHKDLCKDRISALQSGSQDNFMGKRLWEIVQKQHKTDSKSAISLVWSDDFYKLIKSWISFRGLKNAGLLFIKGVNWQQLLPVLKRAVGKDLVDSCPVGLSSKDFRRLHITTILKGKDESVDIKLRNLGTSREVAMANYLNKEDQRYMRAQSLEEINQSPLSRRQPKGAKVKRRLDLTASTSKHPQKKDLQNTPATPMVEKAKRNLDFEEKSPSKSAFFRFLSRKTKKVSSAVSNDQEKPAVQAGGVNASESQNQLPSESDGTNPSETSEPIVGKSAEGVGVGLTTAENQSSQSAEVAIDRPQSPASGDTNVESSDDETDIDSLDPTLSPTSTLEDSNAIETGYKEWKKMTAEADAEYDAMYDREKKLYERESPVISESSSGSEAYSPTDVPCDFSQDLLREPGLGKLKESETVANSPPKSGCSPESRALSDYSDPSSETMDLVTETIEEFNRDLLLESLSSHATLRHDEEVAKVNRAREVEESAFSRYSVAATVDNTTDASQSHLVVETAGQHDFASEEPEAKN